MSSVHYQAIVAAPGFCLGVQCDTDEITGIDLSGAEPSIPGRRRLR